MEQVLCSEIVLFVTMLAVFLYGTKKFFKKGVAMYIQLITAAFGSHALGSLFWICLLITNNEIKSGFQVGYFGIVGSFLFILSANYGQMDGVMDDRSKEFCKYRFFALIAPIICIILSVPMLSSDLSTSSKVVCIIVCVPALLSSYYNMKHAMLPDMGFVFVKAVRPYNIMALVFTYSELVHLNMWMSKNSIGIIITAIVLSLSGVGMMFAVKKGVEQWKI